MSFSKAPLRRFNDIKGHSSLSSPCRPRFITNTSKVDYCNRISFDHGSCSSPSIMSSTASSSLSYSAANAIVKISKNRNRITSFSTLPLQKKPSHAKLRSQDSRISSSSRLNNPIRKNNCSIIHANSSLQHKSSSVLEEKVAIEMISTANEEEQKDWLETISNLQSIVIRMQKSISILEDEITEYKESKRILEMKNEALEKMVLSLQCKLIELDECYKQKENNIEKITELTKTIANLKTSEVQLKQNLKTVKQENNAFAKLMTNFVRKILQLISQESIWKRKEKIYVEVISNLDDIINENQTLLFETEERLGVLVDELENNSRILLHDKIRGSDL